MPWVKSRARFFPLCTPRAAAPTLWSICQRVGALFSLGSSMMLSIHKVVVESIANLCRLKSLITQFPIDL
ncbi:hypothetical protein D3C85_1894180 [compost metagenome]